METYIRFGDLPPDGRSTDHAHDGQLGGVSVYDVHEPETAGVYWPREPKYSYNGGVDQSLFDRPAYLVTGRRVGSGPDGEPVIAQACVVARLVPAKWGGWVVD